MAWIRNAALALTLMLSLGGTPAWAEAREADPKDVGTIEGIVTAFYEVISGPAGVPRQWERDATLYMPGVTFTAMSERQGRPHVSIITPEQFRRMVDTSFVRDGFIETEIGSRIERFNNIAQVRSVYETRETVGGPVTSRGVNYINLYWDGTRWWIANVVWDDERPGGPLPEAWTHPTS